MKTLQDRYQQLAKELEQGKAMLAETQQRAQMLQTTIYRIEGACEVIKEIGEGIGWQTPVEKAVEKAPESTPTTAIPTAPVTVTLSTDSATPAAT